MLPPIDTDEDLEAEDSNVAEAKRWLKKAIARHDRHLKGTEPTDEESQMKMMTEMRRALKALGR